MNLPVPSLLDATQEDLRDGLDAHYFTSCDLVEAYISRIVEVNRQLGAVIELNPDALAIAERCDTERLDLDDDDDDDAAAITTAATASGAVNGFRNGSGGSSSRGKSTRFPLHGIPLLLGDNIATSDRMSTAAGSCVLQGVRVGQPSTIEARLRDAGAVVLGKTNMSEFGGVRGRAVPDGWSARGGQGWGAYFPRQTPQRGAASGSAVAASVGLAWAAVATDTDGSIIVTADANNVVGLRPTVGLTSRHLVIPVSRHLDTVGTLTRSVRDAARLLAAIAGPDPHDEHTQLIPWGDHDRDHDHERKNQRSLHHSHHSRDHDEGTGLPDYLAACQLSGLQGKRIGVPRRAIAAITKRLSPSPFPSSCSSAHPSPPLSSSSSPSSCSIRGFCLDPNQDPGPTHPRGYALPPGILDKVIDILRSAGADIIDDDDEPTALDLPGPLAYLPSPPPSPRDPPHRHPHNHHQHSHQHQAPHSAFPLEHISFMADLPTRYLSKASHNPDAITSLDRLLHLTRTHPQERHPTHDASAWEDALARARAHDSLALASDWERHYLERLAAFDSRGLPAALSRLRLDAVLCPAPVAAFLACPVGLPVLNVPVGSFAAGTPEQAAPWPGLVDVAPNRPFGVSLVGARFGEATLLRVGFALEQGTRARKTVRPLVRPEVDLRDVVAERLGVA